MIDRLAMMLQAQRDLQLRIPPNRDPMQLEGDERAAFMRDMFAALNAELIEALDETGWKPWASSRHFNADRYLGEMVDAWHFFMNLLLVGAAAMEVSPEEYARLFFRAYDSKRIKNIERHKNQTYDGVSMKCPQCHADIAELENPPLAYRPNNDPNTPVRFFCNPEHLKSYLEDPVT